VRIRSVQGDVRVSRGNNQRPDLGKPWVRAQADVAIEEGFSLATGNGRAEIEFEDSSVAYLAENSVLLFKKLRMKNGLPATRLELLTGTATLFVRSLPKESFVLETLTGEMNFPKPEFLRVDSYLDGAALTPEDEQGADVQQPNSKLLHLAKGQTITLPNSLLGSQESQAAPQDEWDAWVSARVNERVAATNAALKASGLTSPIPGLMDLYEQGDFFPCEPYGTCWEVKEQGANENSTQSAKQRQSTNAKSPQRPSDQPLFYRCLPGYRGTPTGLLVNSLPYSAASDLAGAERVYWAVCNYGNFIRRRHHYVWVVGKRHHHPVHWVHVGDKEGFVPRHPNDVRGKLPLNLKNGIFLPPEKTGQAFERIDYDPSQKLTVLTEPPKAFRGESLPKLPFAARPEIHASLVADRASGGKGTVVAGGQRSIGYDYKTENFVLSHIDASGHASKAVVVASLISGASSGAPGNHGTGSTGDGDKSGSRGSGGYGRSGGSGGGESHGGGGGSSGGDGHAGIGGSTEGAGSSGGGSSGGGRPHFKKKDGSWGIEVYGRRLPNDEVYVSIS